MINAYLVIDNMMDRKMPCPMIKALAEAKAFIAPYWQLQHEEEENAIRQFSGTLVNGSNVHFETEEDAKAFRERMEELSDSECPEIPYRPVVYMNDPSSYMTLREHEVLSDFINFQ